MPTLPPPTAQPRPRLWHLLRRGAWALAATLAASPALAWEPTAPVDLVVPAGTGGGADQMARFIAQLAAARNLLRQPINLVNRPFSLV